MLRVCCSANEPAAPVKFMLPPTKRRTVTLLIVLVTALLALAAAFPHTAMQQTAPERNAAAHISVDVNLVVLHAAVTDQKGHHVVSDLSEQDFQVYEDKNPQQIKLFSNEDVPVTAGLAVDHSGSMKRKLAEVSVAARTFVQAGNPGDQIFVVNFNEHVELGLPPSTRFSSDPIQRSRKPSPNPPLPVKQHSTMPSLKRWSC